MVAWVLTTVVVANMAVWVTTTKNGFLLRLFEVLHFRSG
jgi:hypothetical protein